MVEFEFKPTNFDHSGWTSIFHMTTGDDSSRIPGVYYHPNSGIGIWFPYSHNNYRHDFPSPPIGKWTKIRVSQELLDGKFRYRIFIKAFIFLR